MRSMTGFGCGGAPLGEARVHVEVRTVNHRHLDVRVRLPRELGEHAVFVEQRVRARLARGRVDVGVRLDGTGAAALDESRARTTLHALQQMADALGYAERVPLSLLAAVPDLFVTSAGAVAEDAREALEAAVAEAFEALDRSRSTEGAALREAFDELCASLEAGIAEAAARSDGMTERLRARIAGRLRNALPGAVLDEVRLAQEVVLASERADVTEEVTRLRAHAAALRSILRSDGTVGRQLDFLLQEIAREANTLGAKAVEPAVTEAVVALKTGIERLREQAQNVE